MMKSSSQKISEQVLSNGAYKFVALIASIILWLTVLGRKDAMITYEIPVGFEVKSNIALEYDNDTKVKMKISGPRRVLKSYTDSIKQVTFDLRNRAPGIYSIPITGRELNLPLNLRLVALQPEVIEVKIKSRDEDE